MTAHERAVLIEVLHELRSMREELGRIRRGEPPFLVVFS